MRLFEKMAGVAGFEPTNAGIKTQCLATWRHPIDNSKCFAFLYLSSHPSLFGLSSYSAPNISPVLREEETDLRPWQ